MRGHLTEKADVFSFGVVALEIVSGRPNSAPGLEEDRVFLLEWVRMLYLFPFFPSEASMKIKVHNPLTKTLV